MKKKMLLYLLAVGLIGTAQAEVIATLPNRAGGKIVFTDEVCHQNNKTYPNLRRSYMYTDTGETLGGCFVIDGETLWTVWEGGHERRYPISELTMVKRRGSNL